MATTPEEGPTRPGRIAPGGDRPALILASASPRRRRLLEGLGLVFEVRPAEIDERRVGSESPETYVRRLGESKALAVRRPGELVLAADTVVVLDGEILGKPAGPADAESMLTRLSGRRHRVLTGVTLASEDGAKPEALCRSVVVETLVSMASLSAREIAWYVATGEPDDKAGGYAVQGLGALFVESIDGNYSNVVGLPLPTVYRLLAEAGWELLEGARDRGKSAISARTRR